MGLFSMFGGGDDGSGMIKDATGAMVNAAKNAGSLQEQYLREGINATDISYQDALKALNINNAQAVGNLTPYNSAGYSALDALLRSNGLSGPRGGSLGLAQATAALDKINSLKEQQKNVTPGLNHLQMLASRTLGRALQPSDSPTGEINTPRGLLEAVYKIGSDFANGRITPGDSETANKFGELLARQGPQLVQFYDQLGSSITEHEAKLSPEQRQLAESYQSGKLIPEGTSAEASKGALQDFFNNPLYQLQFGNSGAAVDPNASVQDRFQKSPGYEFQLNEGQRLLERSAASRGLLESGTFAKDLNTFGQGVANQEFNNYMGRITSTFGNYQNQLASLAGMGNSTASNISNIQSNAGNAKANLATGYGSNLTNLYSGIGDALANSQLAQGQAQATGLYNQFNNQQANQQSNSQMGSMLGGVLGKIGGTAIGGPIGGMAGGALGSAIGGGLF